ncbi:hypothetical protein LINPERHAP1_LOCUS41270 [Linum perenne]
MSFALGRFILSPSTTSDHLLPPPNNPTHFPSLKFLNRRRNNSHGGKDAGVRLNLSSDGRKPIPITCSSSPKVFKRFSRLYFGRQRDGSDGGKEGNGGASHGGGEGGGGTSADGDSRLVGFPIWWLWQWLKQSKSRDGDLAMVWPPEEQTDIDGGGDRWWQHFLGKVKKHGKNILTSILLAILMPFMYLAITIAGPKLRRPYVPSPIAFFLNFSLVFYITIHLLMGTTLLLTTLLLCWVWRRLHGGEDDDSDQGVDSDDGDDDDES